MQARRMSALIPMRFVALEVSFSFLPFMVEVNLHLQWIENVRKICQKMPELDFSILLDMFEDNYSHSMI